MFRHLKPRAVIGFGGYPTVPPLLAAAFLKIPTVLHELNAIMGKANRFLSGHVDRIAAGLPNLNVPPPLQAKVVVTGNPVRPAVLEAAKLPYPDFAEGAFRLLVTGGSQGARVMADIVPDAIAALAGRSARAHPPRAADARGGYRAGRSDLQKRQCGCRDRALLQGPADAHRAGAFRDRALRRLDRVGTRRHRPPGAVRAAAAFARRRSGGERRLHRSRPARRRR